MCLGGLSPLDAQHSAGVQSPSHLRPPPFDTASAAKLTHPGPGCIRYRCGNRWGAFGPLLWPLFHSAAMEVPDSLEGEQAVRWVLSNYGPNANATSGHNRPPALRENELRRVRFRLRPAR